MHSSQVSTRPMPSCYLHMCNTSNLSLILTKSTLSCDYFQLNCQLTIVNLTVVVNDNLQRESPTHHYNFNSHCCLTPSIVRHLLIIVSSSVITIQASSVHFTYSYLLAHTTLTARTILSLEYRTCLSSQTKRPFHAFFKASYFLVFDPSIQNFLLLLFFFFVVLWYEFDDNRVKIDFIGGEVWRERTIFFVLNFLTDPNTLPSIHIYSDTNDSSSPVLNVHTFSFSNDSHTV